MVTLVVPSGISNGVPVGLYHEWTKDGSGTHKSNHIANATIRSVSSTNEGVIGTFDDIYYTYTATILGDHQKATADSA